MSIDGKCKGVLNYWYDFVITPGTFGEYVLLPRCVKASRRFRFRIQHSGSHVQIVKYVVQGSLPVACHGGCIKVILSCVIL